MPEITINKNLSDDIRYFVMKYLILFYFLAGIVINIECKAWAKNIKHSRADRTGSVHFELLID